MCFIFLTPKQGDDKEGKDEDGSKGDDGEEEKKSDDKQHGQEDKESDEGGDGEDGLDGEGPVNDDLEDNYEEKPMGVEVKGNERGGMVQIFQLCIYISKVLSTANQL